MSDGGDKLLFQDRALLRRIWRSLRPWHRRIVPVVALSLAGALLPLAPPLLLRQVIDTLVAGGSFGQLIEPLVFIVLTGLGAVGIALLANHLAADLSSQIMRGLQVDLYTNLVQRPLSFFATVKPGAIVSRITNDVYATEPLVMDVLVRTVASTATLLGTVVVLFVVDWRLIALILALPLVLLPIRWMEAKINNSLERSFEANRHLSSKLESMLHRDGVMLARQAGQVASEASTLAAAAEDVADVSRDLGRWRADIGATYQFVFTVVTGAIVVFGSWQVSEGALSVGTLILALLYFGQLQGPLTELIGVRYPAYRAGVAFRRIFDVLDAPVGSNSSPRADPGSAPPRGGATLALDKVRFSYPPSAAVAIPGLSHSGGAVSIPWASLTIAESEPDGPADDFASPGFLLEIDELELARGEVLAVVGRSGSGKTTLAMLAAGLLRPDSGRVMIDGLDTAVMEYEELATRVAIISQDSYVLHDTIRGNLRYVAPEASDRELAAVCAAAQLSEWIESLPDGYDTVLGEKGHLMSGGQRQRLSIARAFLRRTAVVIMDEPTSNLDPATEHLVTRAGTSLFADRAVLLLAHRLGTVEGADRAVVMEAGRVVESGTHAQLIQSQGSRYRAIFGADGAGGA